MKVTIQIDDNTPESELPAIFRKADIIARIASVTALYSYTAVKGSNGDRVARIEVQHV